MKNKICIIVLLITGTIQLWAQPTFSKQQLSDTLTVFANKYANALNVNVKKMFLKENVFTVETNENLSYIPFRPDNVNEIKNIIQNMLNNKNIQVKIITDNTCIDDLIPNAYLPVSQRKNFYRLPATSPLVTNTSFPHKISNGLQNKHLAIWGSHGYHYDQNLQRWEWQRARLMQTVEDLYTSSYTMPYLVPMLENAGAIVLQPRERDTQLHEIIVDNDECETQGEFKVHNGKTKWKNTEDNGFCHDKDFYSEGENPFMMGTYKWALTEMDSDKISYVEWCLEIKETGEYAVYIAYKTLPKSIEDAHYIIYHAGGETHFTVNQKMGGSTWIYLGTFRFLKTGNYKIQLSNFSKNSRGIVTADAIKLGGGMGNIARKSMTDSTSTYQLSHYPRYKEGARYYLQWAGIPDSVYNYTEGKNDYTDDFSCRGRWTNYLAGGSAANPNKQGLHIPIQLALAFHTDAGTTPNDSIIGTLAIFTGKNDDKKNTFPTNVSRYNSRDYVDMIQTQIVEDIRATFAPEWERRAIFNKSYSETRNPEMPSMILELLSHQNFADMRYGLDPRFKFTVCRAIYKGILKYIHLQYGTEYIVQPLPVRDFAIQFSDSTNIKLTWQQTIDNLEPTANATQYIVYTKIEDGGFDNGVLTETSAYTASIEIGKHYSFQIVAANAGGISLPSETLSAYIAPHSKGTALIINAFDRICAPESFSFDSTYAGFAPNKYGVPYKYDISYIGEQYEFRRNVPWSDDDAPGFGGSYATHESQITAGNTFDYPYTHGQAIAQNGYSYVSSSASAIDSTQIDSTYVFVDVILGKQKQTRQGIQKKTILYKTFPKNLQNALLKYSQAKTNILVSGAYVASDLWDDTNSTLEDKHFAQNVLHYSWRTNNASQSGVVRSVNNPFKPFKNDEEYSYFTQPNPTKYPIEEPDGIEPFGKNTYTIMRYTDNNISAGIAFQGNYKTCILGFPIEALQNQQEINHLMKNIISFFEK